MNVDYESGGTKTKKWDDPCRYCKEEIIAPKVALVWNSKLEKIEIGHISCFESAHPPNKIARS